MAGHRFFAAVYDRMLAGSEKAGLREMRARMLREASTGHNLPHYPDSVTELVLTEPDPHMAKRLRRKLESDPPGFHVEVSRVLRPGGALIHLERVRDAEGSRRARWQDRLGAAVGSDCGRLPPEPRHREADREQAPGGGGGGGGIPRLRHGVGQAGGPGSSAPPGLMLGFRRRRPGTTTLGGSRC